MEMGNSVRLAVWRSQAERDPKLIEGAQPTFDVRNKAFQDLKVITHLDVDLKEIDDTQTAATEYKNAMNSLLANWRAREEVAKKRSETAQSVLDKAQEIAGAGMDQATEIATGAANALSRSSSIMVIGLFAALVVSILMAIFITRGITQPLKNIFQGLKTFSTAELDETGGKFKAIAEQISSASGQVARRQPTDGPRRERTGVQSGGNLLLPGRDGLHDPPERRQRQQGRQPDAGVGVSTSTAESKP